MTATLGCSRQMQAVVRIAGATEQDTPLHDVSSAKWSRLLDGQGEAEVTVPIRNRSCCESFGDVRPWSHELALYRSGKLVWEGPIVIVDDSRTNSEISFTARDVTAWLGKRRIHFGYNYTTATDLTTIAGQAVRDAIGPRDPDLLRHLIEYPAGVVAQRQVPANRVIALDEINDLARVGLNYTASGRAIILFSETVPLGNLGTLTDEHFQGGLNLQWNGLVAANDVVVIGEGVAGQFAVDGGAYGLLEAAVKSDGTIDQQAADSSARLYVGLSFPPPLIISANSSGVLRSRAPVVINDLIPGVQVTLVARGNCGSVTQNMRLEKLQVEWSDDGETVSVGFAPVVGVT